MSQLLQSERCSHGSSLRRVAPGDAGGRLRRDRRGGVARQPGWTRDDVSQRPAGGVNTSISRRLGKWTGWAMFVWSWVEWVGTDKRPSLGDCHGLPPSARDLPPSAINCHFLPRTASFERGISGLGAGPSTRPSRRIVEDVSTGVWVMRVERLGGRQRAVRRPDSKIRLGPRGGLSPSATSLFWGVTERTRQSGRRLKGLEDETFGRGFGAFELTSRRWPREWSGRWGLGSRDKVYRRSASIRARHSRSRRW